MAPSPRPTATTRCLRARARADHGAPTSSPARAARCRPSWAGRSPARVRRALLGRPGPQRGAVRPTTARCAPRASAPRCSRTTCASGSPAGARCSPIDEIFELVVDSAFVGMRKPDPEIYELTWSGSAWRPSECLFVDDIEVERRGGAGASASGRCSTAIPSRRWPRAERAGGRLAGRPGARRRGRRGRRRAGRDGRRGPRGGPRAGRRTARRVAASPARHVRSRVRAQTRPDPGGPLPASRARRAALRPRGARRRARRAPRQPRGGGARRRPRRRDGGRGLRRSRRPGGARARRRVPARAALPQRPRLVRPRPRAGPRPRRGGGHDRVGPRQGRRRRAPWRRRARARARGRPRPVGPGARDARRASGGGALRGRPRSRPGPPTPPPTRCWASLPGRCSAARSTASSPRASARAACVTRCAPMGRRSPSTSACTPVTRPTGPAPRPCSSTPPRAWTRRVRWSGGPAARRSSRRWASARWPA